MRLLLSIIGLFFFCADVAAQSDFLNQSNSIAPGIKKDSPTSGTSTNSIYTPNVFNPNKTASSSSSTIPDRPIDMTTQTFANPGDQYKDGLNKKLAAEGNPNIDTKQFRKNVYFGDIKTKSAYIRVLYRDGGDVDGDEIKLSVNGYVQYAKMYLAYEYKELRIDLVPGFNKIDFEALNEGLYTPNTASFTILDEDAKVMISNQWNLSTGFKATYIVIKE